MHTKGTTATAIAALMAFGAQAGELDRSNQPIGAVFAPSGTFEFSIGRVEPSVTGEDIGNTGSYDAVRGYTQLGASYTQDINSQFSYSIIVDEPFGSDVFYDDDPLTSNLGGTSASIDTTSITFVGRYKFSDRFSVYGGPRFQQAGGTVRLNGAAYRTAFGARAVATQLGFSTDDLAAAAAGNRAAFATVAGALVGAGVIPAAAASNPAIVAAALQGAVANGQGAFAATGGYRVDLEDEIEIGYVLGAAYEIPDIALRASATYNSAIEYDAATSEQIFAPSVETGATTYKTPQSINLDFQTGIAEGTLLTASYRWADWSEFDVIPPVLGRNLSTTEDVHRFTIGVARRFNEAFAGSVTLAYERERNDGVVSPLNPTDGQVGLTVGGRYTADNLDVTGGLNYTWIGEAQPGVGGQPVASFEDNHAVGVGLRVAYRF